MAQHRLFKSRSKKRGLAPGSPVYTGAESGRTVGIHLFHYGPDHLEENQATSAEQALAAREGGGEVTWLDLDGIHDVAMLQQLGDRLGLHPLAMEDIVSTDQRAKTDEYEQTLLIVMKMLRWDDAAGGLNIEQVSIVLGRDFVASFQERPGDVFEPLRERIRSAKSRVRKLGADYLAYCLIDAIVDGYFAVQERLGERVEELEARTILQSDPKMLEQIYQLKRETLFLRRSVWPVRELVTSLERVEPPLVTETLSPYLRDLYDHAVQVIDTTETMREMLSGLLEAYLSGLSNRMNEVMKVLTIIATIFIPLTFIAGIYGMNFQHMPELAWRWAYPTAMVVMAVIAGAMLYYFRRKRWL